MTLTESSIYISIKRLRTLLFQAQFDMPKGYRIVYGTPIMQNIGLALSSYVLAFTVTEQKVQYLESAIGYFSIVRTDLEFCVENNIIHFCKRKVEPKKDKQGNELPIDARDEVNTTKIEIFKLIAKIDNDMCRWRASLAKGKTIRE